MNLKINSKGLQGEISVPGDKSISHRAVMFGAISHGETKIQGLLHSEDVERTIEAFKSLGVKITVGKNDTTVFGKGFSGLQGSKEPIYLGNSGTSMRLLSGIVAGCDFSTTFTGDVSLSKRPMDRIAQPLEQMGATVKGVGEKNTPPLTIRGTNNLQPLHYKQTIASAQVKSAIMFAAMQATGETTIVEKEKSRNHTEEMFQLFGGNLRVNGKEISIEGGQKLFGQEVVVPGDISSAAFFIVAGLIVPNSKITLKNVGLNPTRDGIIEVVQKMGGKISIDRHSEFSGDITVETSELKGIKIGGSLIPRLIDELPIIALLATQAVGETVIYNAEELRVKETDRITATSEMLNKLGANVTPTADGMKILGKTPLKEATLSTHHDHRMGMTAQIAALLVKEGQVFLNDSQAIQTSYPTFFKDLESLSV